MMLSSTPIFSVVLFASVFWGFENQWLSGQTISFEYSSYTNQGYQFDLYDFDMNWNTKVKYFSKNAYTEYQNWQAGHSVQLICAGAFSETWDSDSKPVGFTVDNGEVVNYQMDPEMDGLVLITDDGILCWDLDYLENGVFVEGEGILSTNPRESAIDRINLASEAEEHEWTIFQTHLVYSDDRLYNFGNLKYGEARERRFLGICTIDDELHNVIVDAPNELELNLSALYAKEVLDHVGFKVYYLLNLDTGGKNILAILQDSQYLSYKYDDTIEEATNLIIFYK